MKRIVRRAALPLLLMGLAGCYYPVPVYPAYPPPPPAYPVYPYGYAPPPQPYPAPAANNGQECREYTKSAIIAGERQQIEGTACRQPDGTWKDNTNDAAVNEPPPPPPPLPVAPPQNQPPTPTMPEQSYPTPPYGNAPVPGR